MGESLWPGVEPEVGAEDDVIICLGIVPPL
jgi:hypothetical protein